MSALGTDGKPLPHVCPFCGTPFGWAADLLQVPSRARFNEPMPCCGRVATGVIVDGTIEWDEA